MDQFTERYTKLNKAQKEAVDTIEGPVMVVAGPGTGKTTILTLRIANILKQTDTPPSGILAITFTDAGVKAMKAGLRKIIGGRADEVRIHTFHGFASSLIAEFPEHFVDIDGFTQMTDIDTDALLRNILEAPVFSVLRPLGKPDLYMHGIVSSISEAKREALSPEDIRSYTAKEIKTIQQDPSAISTRGATKGELKAEAKKKIEKLEKTAVFADVYQAYEDGKKEGKFLDYDDLIFKTVLALGRDELLLRLVQEKFLYLLVDEHQDTNDSQNLLIRQIADFFESPNIFIVGDEKQAIYRFQGASVENFLQFGKVWPSMKTISLEENYRSHQHILDASFGIIEKNYKEDEHQKLRIKLSSGTKTKGKPITLMYPADRDMAEGYLAHELKRIEEQEPDKTVAVIARSNRDVDRVIRLAEAHNIAISADRSIDIFSHPIGITFFALAGFLRDPLDVESLGKTLLAGLWGIDFARSVELVKMLRKGHVEEAVRNISSLSKIRRTLTDDSPMLFLITLSKESGFQKLISSDPAYVEVWRGILGLAEQIVKQSKVSDPSLLLEKLIAYKASAERKNISISVGSPEKNIRVMTAHGSKGLEYDYVFIPYATEESWLPRKRSSHFLLPSKKTQQEGDDVRDARRLFYVALTRAREHAVILSPIEDMSGDLNTPLRFLDEIDPSSASREIFPDDIVPASMTPITQTSRPSKIVDFAKTSLLETGLSVTALNNFLTCPNHFLFSSILRIPSAPSATAEKGIAMHTAFDKIWKESEEKRNEKKVRDIIETVARESVGASYLRIFEKEAVIKELLKNAPAVAKSLLPHFHTKGVVSVEEWSETLLTTSYDGKDIPIRLHGKLDAVIDTGNEVLVFDYKTRKKMSANEIKGDTKSSDGGYFRQLVFYRMLLENESKAKGKAIIPSLVFLTPDEKGVCHIETLSINEQDLSEVRGLVQSLVDSVWSGAIISTTCEDEKCEWCAISALLQ